MISSPLTAERLRELLAFDRDSGVFRWRVVPPGNRAAGDVAGGLCGAGYIVITIDGRAHFAHRLAWLYVTGQWPRRMIDHIDGARTNNRFLNLRDVSRAVNGQNQKQAQRHNTTGHLGVTRLNGSRSKPYQAGITVDGRFKYLGVFKTGEEASAVYLDAKRRLHEGCTL